MTEGWVPTFEGQRPPFEPGNDLAVKHGAYSPRKVDPLASELVEYITAHVPQLESPMWRPAVWAWARAEAQVQLLSEYLAVEAAATGDGVGDLEKDRTRSAYLLLHRAEARAMAGRSRLGLDPLSSARLGRDRASAAVDTARLMQELGRQAEQREASSSQGVEGSS